MPIAKATPEKIARARAQLDAAGLDAMTDAEITQAALADPDNPPLTDDELARVAIGRRLKGIRARLSLSQEDFALRFRLPAASVRDWEQGRRAPDRALWVLLSVIDSDPEFVMNALPRVPVEASTHDGKVLIRYAAGEPVYLLQPIAARRLAKLLERDGEMEAASMVLGAIP